jgi:hypothetical protein
MGVYTLMDESPGQAPPTKDPPLQPSPTFKHVPLPELVLQVFFTQHWMSAAPGHLPAMLKPCVVQSDVFWQVPAPKPESQEPPMARMSRGEVAGLARVVAARARREAWTEKCMLVGRIETM